MLSSGLIHLRPPAVSLFTNTAFTTHRSKTSRSSGEYNGISIPKSRLLFANPNGFYRLSNSKSRDLPFACFYDKKEDLHLGVNWPILLRWDVPWDWHTVLISMIACGSSFSLAGLVEAIAWPYICFEGVEVSLDQKAVIILVGQLVATTAVFCILYGITSTFQPVSKDIFHYDLKEPFNAKCGWLYWAVIGLFGALISMALLGVLLNIINLEQPQRKTDALIRLLPLIGASSTSTACLIGITGILAPLLEETVFRGFLMVSLTKWFPTPVSVLLSAALFSFVHLSPGEFPQLFVLGTALGLSYAHTRNLLTPITIHAFWNSGVILLLTLKQLQGHELPEILQPH